MQRSQTTLAPARQRQTLHEWVQSSGRRGAIARLLVIAALALGVAAMHTMLDGAHPAPGPAAVATVAEHPAFHAPEDARAPEAGPMSHMCMTLLTSAVFATAILPGLSGPDLLAAGHLVAVPSTRVAISGLSRTLKLCVLRL